MCSPASREYQDVARMCACLLIVSDQLQEVPYAHNLSSINFYGIIGFGSSNWILWYIQFYVSTKVVRVMACWKFYMFLGPRRQETYQLPL